MILRFFCFVNILFFALATHSFGEVLVLQVRGRYVPAACAAGVFGDSVRQNFIHLALPTLKTSVKGGQVAGVESPMSIKFSQCASDTKISARVEFHTTEDVVDEGYFPLHVGRFDGERSKKFALYIKDQDNIFIAPNKGSTSIAALRDGASAHFVVGYYYRRGATENSGVELFSSVRVVLTFL